MRICIISYNYPGKFDSVGGAFVKQLVDALAKRGNNCIVISPYNINHFKRITSAKETYRIDNAEVTVYRPWYFSFSNLTIFGYRISNMIHQWAVNAALRSMKVQPDVIYGHFWGVAFEGYKYASRKGLPLFVATGESEIAFRRSEKTESFCNYVKGVVCVSTKNKDESIGLHLTTADKCIVAPNAINNSLFRKLDKEKCRKKFGVPLDAFVVIFVGWFDQRKGSRRVSEALKAVSNNIHSIFIGKGNEEPDCPNILFKGQVTHERIPEYMNAADVFVLPTLHEGCCNAIVEALACGLPVISSDLPFNKDVLDNENSIRVDPTNVKQISEAIEKLYNDRVLLEQLSRGALTSAKKLTIDQRARIIEDFIKEKQYE